MMFCGGLKRMDWGAKKKRIPPARKKTEHKQEDKDNEFFWRRRRRRWWWWWWQTCVTRWNIRRMCWHRHSVYIYRNICSSIYIYYIYLFIYLYGTKKDRCCHLSLSEANRLGKRTSTRQSSSLSLELACAVVIRVLKNALWGAETRAKRWIA